MQVGPRPPRGAPASSLVERREFRKKYRNTVYRLLMGICGERTTAIRHLNSTLENTVIEDYLFQQFYTSLLQQMSSPDSKIFEPQRTDFDDEPPMVLDFEDIEVFSDEDFWKNFHVTRNTLKHLFYHIREAVPHENHSFTTSTDAKGIAANVPIKKTIILTLWYLRNKTNKLSDAKKLFHLPSYEVVEAVLERGFKIIIALKPKALLYLPAIHKFKDTANYFYRHHSIKNIMGVLCHNILVNEKGERMLLQACVNEKKMFFIAETSFDTTIRASFGMNRDIVRTFNTVPQEFRLAADQEYKSVRPPRSFVKIITPYLGSSKDLTPDEALYNERFQSVLSFGYDCLNDTIKRFPRITCLHRCLPEAVIAACVLHNYCTLLNDHAPFFLQ